MKPVAEALAKRLPDAAFVFNDGPMDVGQGKSWYVLRGEDTNNTKAVAKELAVKTVKTAAERSEGEAAGHRCRGIQSRRRCGVRRRFLLDTGRESNRVAGGDSQLDFV